MSYRVKANSQITASKILAKCLEIYDGEMINEIAGIVSEYAEAYAKEKLDKATERAITSVREIKAAQRYSWTDSEDAVLRAAIMGEDA